MEPQLSPEPRISRDLEAELAEFMIRLDAFCKKESKLCPYCMKEAESVEKIGEFVYINPCHHKLYEGYPPEAWIETEAPR